jgi:hypothetical protein
VEEEVAAPVYKIEITAVRIRRADHSTPHYLQKLTLTSPTSGCRLVSIVRSQTKAKELVIAKVDFTACIEINYGKLVRKFSCSIGSVCSEVSVDAV